MRGSRGNAARGSPMSSQYFKILLVTPHTAVTLIRGCKGPLGHDAAAKR